MTLYLPLQHPFIPTQSVTIALPPTTKTHTLSDER